MAFQTLLWMMPMWAEPLRDAIQFSLPIAGQLDKGIYRGLSQPEIF